MTDRSVSVRMSLVARDYIAEAKRAADATDRLAGAQQKLVASSGRFGQALTASGRDLGRYALQAEHAADAVQTLGGAHDAAVRGTRQVGRAADRSATQLDKYAVSATAASAATRALADAQDKITIVRPPVLGTRSGGGEDAVRGFAQKLNAGLRSLHLPEIDIKASPKGALAAIAVTELKLKELAHRAPTIEVRVQARRSLADLARLGDEAGVGVGKQMVPGILGSLSSSLRGMGASPTLIAGAAALGAAIAPFAGAAMAAGIVGGAAGTGILGGVALAARNSEVKAAFQALTDDLSARLERAAQPFVPAVIDAMAVARREFATLEPELSAIFAQSSQYLAPLVRGISGMAQTMAPQIRNLVAAAQPIIDEIAAGLPMLGQAFADVFADMAGNADEGAMAVRNLFQFMAEGVRVTGAIINGLSDLYGWLIRNSEAAANFGVAVTGWIPLLGDHVKLWRDNVAGMREDLDRTGESGRRGGAGVFGFGEATAGAAGAAQQLSDRQKILNGDMSAAIALAGDLGEALRVLNGGAVDAERAEIAYQEAIDRVTESIAENGKTTNEHTEKGRANRTALLALRDAAEQRAVAVYESTKATRGEQAAQTAANGVLQQGRAALINAAMAAGKSKAEAIAYANSILRIPKNWNTNIEVHAQRASAVVNEINAKIQSLRDKHVTITMDAVLSNSAISLGNLTHQRWGGVAVPMAAGGMLSAGIYPASNPPLVKFAEPETGGEAYVPRKGDPGRSKAILSEAASWYGMQVTPMAAGGVLAAATGLVNVAAGDAVNPRATRLDSADAYIRARDAATSLNGALKENGRSFSLSTAKGRENTSAVYSVIKAAQDAARTKFDETGSVKQANAAYDAHILRLRRTLAQQRINASTIRQLLSVAARPAYDVAARAPVNSLANIAFAKSYIGASAGIEDLRDKLSLNRAGLSPNTPEGRENLLAILGFLEQASSAAQDRFSQTKNAGSATNVYNGFLAQLRAAMVANGYSSAAINSLLSTYGRITLQPNAAGGVYMAAAGVASLRQPALYPAGRTMYGFAEASTGGEAFIPRFGDRQRGRELAQVAAGWYGGRVSYGGTGGGGGDTHVTNNLTVTPLKADMSVTELQGILRGLDIQARYGRRR